MSRWVKNSIRAVIPTNNTVLLYFTIVLGVFVLGHSFYLHNKKWRKVRIANDVAAAALIGQSICFIRCSVYPCDLRMQAIFNDFLANAVFGALIQIADNFMTFSRYSVVCGGVSRRHKILAFFWVFLTLYATWWELFSFFPFFFDLNSPWWLKANYVLSFITFSSYFAFDLFYFFMLIPYLVKAENQTIPSSQYGGVYRVFAAKAAGHTLLSMAGICMYTFHFPVGMIEQNMITVIGIHFFLNWTNSHELLQKWVSKRKKICNFKRAFLRVRVYASNSAPFKEANKEAGQN